MKCVIKCKSLAYKAGFCVSGDLGLHQVTTPVCNGLPFHRLFPDNRKALPSPRDSARRKKLF